MPVDQPASEGRGEAHDGQRDGKPAIDEVAAPAEIGGDDAAEPADQVIGRAPADELRQAEIEDGAAEDHAGDPAEGERGRCRPAIHLRGYLPKYPPLRLASLGTSPPLRERRCRAPSV